MENVNKQLLERWVVFGKAMQKAGSELPRYLIADTEKVISETEQARPFVWWSDASREVWVALESGLDLKHDERDAYLSSVEISGAIPLYTQPPVQQHAEPVARDEPVELDDEDIINIADANGFDINTPEGVIELCKAVASYAAMLATAQNVE